MTSRVDMHCHSTASQLSRLGVQRSLGIARVRDAAARRSTSWPSDGGWTSSRSPTTTRSTAACELADRPDCFVSEELTARFAGEPQAVHVLCYGITPGDHEWLQAHAGDVEACAAYLARERDRLRTGAPVLQRRRTADAAAPAAARRALPDLGGPQRLARRGAEHAGGDLHRDPWRHRHRRLRRPCRRGHRPHLHRGARGRHAGRVSRTTCGAAMPRRAASRAAPPSGLTRRWRWRRALSAGRVAAGGHPTPPPY